MGKTCGGCCKACKNGEQLTSVHCEIHHVTIDGDGRCYCGGEDFVGRTDTLEQRCQQLEQVAREMYRELESVTDRRLDCRTRDDLLSVYFGKLYDLGVSLDD